MKLFGSKIKNSYIIGLLAVAITLGVVAFACVLALGVSGTSAKNSISIQNATNNTMLAETLSGESDGVKLYEYKVTNALNGGYNILGFYEGNIAYNLSGESSVAFEEIMALIDDDRAINKSLADVRYADAVINFDDVTYTGNAYLNFSNGYYSIKGSLDCLGYSIFGLIYINNADVMLDDIDIKNIGASVSYLIRSYGKCNININKSTLTCTSTVIISYGNATMSVSDSEVKSSTSSAIVVMGDDVSKTHISGASSVIQGNVAGGGALYIENCSANIWRGNFTNPLGYGIKVNRADLQLSGTPSIQGQSADIQTNQTISASNGNADYAGGPVRVLYVSKGTASINGTRVVANVTDYNADLFECIINGYDFHRIGNDLYVEKFFNITYNANLNGVVGADSAEITARLPSDSRNYFNNEKITLSFLDENIRMHYKFRGWSETSTAITPMYDAVSNFVIVNNANITLYAVWEAVKYSINYEGVYQINENDNPSFYTVEDNITLNAPVKEYYSFMGWTYGDVTTPNLNVTIPTGSFGSKTFTANFEIATYNIIYHNIKPNEVETLYKKTAYTINDDSYKLNLREFVLSGYSVYGIYYDEEMTISCDGDTLYFKLGDLSKNSDAFFLSGNKIGKDINIYIDAKMYHKGEGRGTETNPYIVSEPKHFAVLLSGYKLKTANIYIALENDLDLTGIGFGVMVEGLSNLSIDGRNHSIKIDKLNTFNGYTALIPLANNVSIKNLTLLAENALMYQNALDGNVKVATLVGLANNLSLQNINNQVNLKVVTTNVGGSIATHYVSNLVCRTIGDCNIINKVKNSGKVDVTLYDGRSVELYASAYVADAKNVVIVNCENMGDFAVNSNISDRYQTMMYAGVFANLNNASCVLNSINYANATIRQLSECWASASGVANVIGSGAQLNNVVNCGHIAVLNANSNPFAKGFNASICFSGDINTSVKNAYSNVDAKMYAYNVNSATFEKVDSDAVKLIKDTDLSSGKLIKLLNAKIEEINSILSSLSSSLNAIRESNASNTLNDQTMNDYEFIYNVFDLVELDYVTYNGLVADEWYYSVNGNTPTQTKTLLVKFSLGGVLEDREVVYDLGVGSKYATNANKILDEYSPLSYKKHYFKGWYANKNLTKEADLKNAQGGTITVYAKWEPLSSSVNSCMLIIVLLELLALAVLILALYLFDKKKMVTFIIDGSVACQKPYARTKHIEKPTQSVGDVWFTDPSGETAFTSWQMPYYPLNLWQFDAEKQARCEKAYYDKLEFQKTAQAELETLEKEKHAKRLAELDAKKSKQQEDAKARKAKREAEKIAKERAKLEKQFKREQENEAKELLKQAKAEDKRKFAVAINEQKQADAISEINLVNSNAENQVPNAGKGAENEFDIALTEKNVKKTKTTAKNSEKAEEIDSSKPKKATTEKIASEKIEEKVQEKPKKNVKKSTAKQSNKNNDEDLDSNITIIQKEIKVRKNSESDKID